MDEPLIVEIHVCANPFHRTRLDQIGFFNLKLHKVSSFNDFYETLCQKIEKVHNTKKMRLVNLSIQKSGKVNVLIWFEEESQNVERFNVEDIVKNWPKKYRWGLNQPFGQFVDNWMEFEKQMEISTLSKNKNSYGDDKNESPYSLMYSPSLHDPILPHVQTFHEYALACRGSCTVHPNMQY